ncbi:hypothetical protein RV08_GL000875 [Enterococcus mundtii]|uniref:hypothetical protein n=1 Tax=Enterococcus mundtii TaxID=53346 RepID=UPI00091238E3|nr:hypothetical protein [Enterococcus mundtii]NAA58128.1 hypothetical protein [Enterococcus mundtii]NAA90705.1 hypothetical protein [Enterococcus mundtii]OJG59839.1 hypothetical protein RV08_GL000875 [Enterococcus mundtii]
MIIDKKAFKKAINDVVDHYLFFQTYCLINRPWVYVLDKKEEGTIVPPLLAQ